MVRQVEALCSHRVSKLRLSRGEVMVRPVVTVPRAPVRRALIACHVRDAASGLDQGQDFAAELGGVSTTSHDALLQGSRGPRIQKFDSEKRRPHHSEPTLQRPRTPKLADRSCRDTFRADGPPRPSGEPRVAFRSEALAWYIDSVGSPRFPMLRVPTRTREDSRSPWRSGSTVGRGRAL